MRGVFVPLVAAIVFALCGWWFGRRINEATPPVPHAFKPSAEAHAESTASPEAGGFAVQNAISLSDGIDKILAETTAQAQRCQLYLLASRLRSEDFPAVLASLRASGKKESSTLHEDLAAFWFEHDLSAARAWLSSLPPAERDGLFAAVVSTWGRIDLADVFAWLRELPQDEQSRLASANRDDLSRLLAESNPAAAADFLIANPVPPSATYDGDFRVGEWKVFYDWAKVDPQAASRRISEVPLKRRLLAAMGLIDSWAELDPAGAEAWLATIDDAPLLRTASKVYVSTRAQRNPAAAAAYMIQNWGPQFEEDGELNVVLSRWGSQDDAAAMAWAKALPDQELREQALYDLLRSIGYDRPQRAAELWMSEFGDGKGSGWSSARYIARELSQGHGFDAAADFLAKVPAKDRAFTIEQFFGEEVRRVGAIPLVQTVLQRPPSSERVELIRPAFQRLAMEGEVVDARRLLESVPAGTERQAAIGGLITGELGRNPDGAFQLATSLLGAVDGPRMASAELMRIYEPHKSELKKWIQKTSLLSPGEKDRILNRGKQNGN